MLDSNLLWGIVLLMAFLGLIADLIVQSKLFGRPRHHYRHVPEHMRQTGSLNTTNRKHIDWYRF